VRRAVEDGTPACELVDEITDVCQQVIDSGDPSSMVVAMLLRHEVAAGR
jgi:hypothetical protein